MCTYFQHVSYSCLLIISIHKSTSLEPELLIVGLCISSAFIDFFSHIGNSNIGLPSLSIKQFLFKLEYWKLNLLVLKLGSPVLGNIITLQLFSKSLTLVYSAVNGNSGVHRGMDRSDINSCSSSTDSHDTVDEEKRLLYEILSQLQPPQVRVTRSSVPSDKCDFFKFCGRKIRISTLIYVNSSTKVREICS